MNKEIFVWNKHLKILLYGVNQYSRILADRLIECGMNVCAYIDRRADELKSINEIVVIDLNNEFFLKDDKKNICVIVMLQNALQHDYIAEQLHNKGISNIIFVPMRLRYEQQRAIEMIEIYNSIFLGDFTSVENIPCYNSLVKRELDRNVYFETKEYVVVGVAADIIYTNPPQTAKKEKNILRYADVPIMAYKPYVQMLEYFEGGVQEGSIDEYLYDYGVNSCNYSHEFTNKKIIRQRQELYDVWSAQFQYGIDYFAASAPLAQWNEKGYFNLLEGQHRTLFLIKKGICYVPIRLRKTEWIKCKEELKKLSDNEMSRIESMLSIQQYLPREIYTGKNVLSIDECKGYYGYNLKKMGAAEVYILDAKQIHCQDLEETLDSFSEYTFASVIGMGICCMEIKKKLIEDLKKASLRRVMISLSVKEIKQLDREIKKKMRCISKVFIEDEMIGIYLLTNI